MTRPGADERKGRRQAPAQPTEEGGSLLDRWWMQALVSAWMLLVVVTYFRLQLTRLLEIAGR